MRAELAVTGLLVVTAFISAAVAAERELRVCADPNNLPFSNQAEEGFENVLAEMVAEELQAELSYTWWAQRRGFIRNTLNADACDLVVGVPAGYEMVETTKPYYRSSYVFVHGAGLDPPLQAISDPRLRDLTIGVHLTGDDGANPPPAHALGRRGIVDNVVGYMIYGDYREANPPARLIEAVSEGTLDVAAVWGPTGGYFARRAAEPLEVHSIRGAAAVPFEFSIAMGVRKGETALRDEIQDILLRRRDDIRDVLLSYHLPLVDAGDGEQEVTKR